MRFRRQGAVIAAALAGRGGSMHTAITAVFWVLGLAAVAGVGFCVWGVSRMRGGQASPIESDFDESDGLPRGHFAPMNGRGYLSPGGE